MFNLECFSCRYYFQDNKLRFYCDDCKLSNKELPWYTRNQKLGEIRICRIRKCQVKFKVDPDEYINQQHCNRCSREWTRIHRNYLRQVKKKEDLSKSKDRAVSIIIAPPKTQTLITASNTAVTIKRRDRKGKTIPKGYYVYGWYQPKAIFPFYIGMGTGNRAWDIHKGAFCERIRTPEISIEIYKDDLTREEAYLIEGVIVKLLRNCGIILANQH
jgi:hypothetical protein